MGTGKKKSVKKEEVAEEVVTRATRVAVAREAAVQATLFAFFYFFVNEIDSPS